MSVDEDRMRIDPRLIKIGLLAIDAVAEHYAVPFHDLTLDEKRQFLDKHGDEIIKTAQQSELGRYFENRVVLLVENNGTAGLIFTKRGANGPR